MLTALHIENIAIIDRLDLEFQSGFTVLTGETGAGKSIIIDSILLLLGNKASKDMIRSGTDAGVVSACFCNLSAEAVALLASNDLSPDEDGNVTVYRKLGTDGRNTAKVNGINVTVSFLKELGTHLISIHGQHDGVLLLDSKRHLGYLDEFGCPDKEKQNYVKAFDEVKGLRDLLQKLQEQSVNKEQRRAQLTQWINALDECDLKAGEHEELLLRRKNMMANADITEALHTATGAIYDGELPAAQLAKNAMDAMLTVEKLLPQGAQLVSRLKQLSTELDDLGTELGKLFDTYQSDQMDPEIIESRLDQLEAIKKEFGPTDQKVLENQNQFKSELSQLDNGEDRIKETEAAFIAARARLDDYAEKLTVARKKAALEMKKRLQGELAYLDMPKVQFEVQIADRLNERGGIRYRTDGKDDVEFFISANKGEAPRPLAKIASGGELSRIMLSIKSVLTKGFDTVIYDEVDTGVSGGTAEKIGKKLQSGAADQQVFCITHLAQIAALADHHIKVTKDEVNGRVCSNIRVLNNDERVAEIARIMGGEEMTEALLQSAKEMLESRKK
ncbi:MAG: DNA repair protein RecN [Clostridia bacterium]|nr:DNA repair protein RecN [Clostridia bacterium]